MRDIFFIPFLIKRRLAEKSNDFKMIAFVKIIAFSIRTKADNRKSSNVPPSIGSRTSPIAEFLSQTHQVSVIARFISLNISQDDRLGDLNISEKENEKLRMNREGFAEKKGDIFQLVKTDEAESANNVAIIRW